MPGNFNSGIHCFDQSEGFGGERNSQSSIVNRIASLRFGEIELVPFPINILAFYRQGAEDAKSIIVFLYSKHLCMLGVLAVKKYTTIFENRH
jgi:hypothetical protein